MKILRPDELWEIEFEKLEKMEDIDENNENV